MDRVQDFDIAFIGAGLSSTATLMRLAERLLSQGRSHGGTAPLKVAMIDKSTDVFAGIAYGDRSGPTSLIITPLDEFLPPDELRPFIAWMKDHQDQLAAELRSKGGPLSQDLAGRFEKALDDGTCAKTHVPRAFFGRYLKEKATALLDEAKQAGLIDCHRIRAEVDGFERTTGGYRISISSGAKAIDCRTAVLGLGTPPSRKLFVDSDDPAIADRLIEDPYAPSMTDSLMQSVNALEDTPLDTPPDILLIGANASCLEMLYLLCDLTVLNQRRPTFHVLSPQGRMPERFVGVDGTRFEAEHLQALIGKADVSAADLLDAAKADLEIARADNLMIGETMPVISRLVGQLVTQQLSPKERQTFVNHVGVEIGRIQRRAGEEYSDIVDGLQSQGRLNILEGRFTSVAAAADGQLKVTYQERATGETRTLDRPVALAVNCSGSAGLKRPNTCPLIETLLETGLCRANPSSFGFEVDDHMAASDHLYVIGPMLAGNVVAGTPIWHVEHCGRILDFSAKLADELLFDMSCDVAAE